MNWAYELLGIPLDADERSIKRAYAQQLRTTRPDEDAEAFQRLHAAYKFALARAAQRGGAASSNALVARQPDLPAATPTPTPSSSDTQASEPVLPATATPPSPAPTRIVTINANELADSVITSAIQIEGDGELTRLLQSRPEFWSIQVKQQIGQMVLGKLFKHPQSMSSHNLDAVLHFFDLNHVLSGVNPFALQQLRIRQSLQWELQPDHHHALAHRTGLMIWNKPDLDRVRGYLELLQQPLRWYHIAAAALSSQRINDRGNFVRALCGGMFDEIWPPLNRTQALFWHRASTRGPMIWQRFAINTARAIYISVTLALATLLLCWLAWEPGDTVRSRIVAPMATVSIGTLIAWLAVAGWVWLDAWQRLPETRSSGWTWLQRLTIPLLCVVGLGVDYLADLPSIGGSMVALALLLALRRWLARRSPAATRFSFGSLRAPLWIGGVLLINAYRSFAHDNPGTPDIPFAAIGAAVTMCLWLADTWSHRTILWPKTA